MLKVLVASQPARTSWFAGTTFSTVTHGALIALAMTATGRGMTSVEEERAIAPERITYLETRPFVEHMKAESKAAGGEAKPAEAPPLVMPDINSVQDALSDLKIPDVTAAPDLTQVTDAWAGAPDDISQHRGESIIGLILARSTFARPVDGVYTEANVERTVMPKRGNPTPRYPRQLQEMGIEGDFVVKYVVDSTGVVLENQVEFPSTMHRLFAEAVRVALRKSRYQPASIGGHAVQQLVIQEFRFTIKER